MNKILPIVLFTLVIAGCVGVAGTAKDDDAVSSAAQNYKGYVAPSVDVTPIKDKAKKRYSPEDIFRKHPRGITVAQDGNGVINDNKITFINQKLTIINKNGKYEIQLPHAFYFTALRACIETINNKSIFTFVVRSRHTTGRRFVGVIDLDKMEHLYLYSHLSEDASDIIIENNIIKILGWEDCTNSTQLTLK
jgi:hypothetical protein